MRLYDTQSRELMNLQPIDGTQFRFYCCGPTVYGPAHIGNFRTFVLQDVFRRVLELGGTAARHVRNLTDVDDKTIRESQASGQSLSDFTAVWTEKFHKDCAALNCLIPHVEPSAVAHIPQQIQMIEKLVEKGNAYASEDGSVYFKISSFPEYGKLSRLQSRDIDLGRTQNTRVNHSDEYEKDSVADFVLWKARQDVDGENYWTSPWGEGRPGWHIECSAMIYEQFGSDFDLHSGGEDLIFPHHENEIAQSRSACGGKFAAHWFHITHLLVEGKKMSKSAGNFYVLQDLLDKGFSAAEVRYNLIGTHYRKQLNFTLDGLHAAREALLKLARGEQALADRVIEQEGSLPELSYDSLKGVKELGLFENAWQGVLEDLNTQRAIGSVFGSLRRALNEQDALSQWRGLHFMLFALGIELPSLEVEKVEVPMGILDLAQQRWSARLSKDWAESDRLRDVLSEQGWIVKDGKDGYEVVPSDQK